MRSVATARRSSFPPLSVRRRLMTVHWILFYDLVDDYLDRRAQFRNDHLGLARAAAERGDIVMAGALADPADQAVLVFTGDSPTAAEEFARADPYVAN